RAQDRYVYLACVSDGVNRWIGWIGSMGLMGVDGVNGDNPINLTCPIHPINPINPVCSLHSHSGTAGTRIRSTSGRSKPKSAARIDRSARRSARTLFSAVVPSRTVRSRFIIDTRPRVEMARSIRLVTKGDEGNVDTK